ncbi:MAG: hypothetical protein CSA70_12105 [Rhodobacterales bacterium]|nr:MAG: hypothetical protein CR993_01110 [Rhodobacterales bacterium]PIE10077.1 MAG: hypothetical protein CSA70_12105 [Rhodobacterales bacterium]
MKHSPLALIVALLAVGFAISPIFSNGFGGFAPEYFPVLQIDPPVQPAGYAFSIWGVIFFALIASSLYGVLRAPDDPDWQAMRPALSVSLGLGVFWIAAANAAPPLATMMILLMAAGAVRAMLVAGEAKPWLLVRPIALYAGWLTAASGVAIGVLLGGYGVLSPQSAALLCLGLVLLTALIIQSRRPGEWAYPAAVIWALVGVLVDNLPGPNLPVIALTALGIALLGARIVLTLIKGALP